MLGPVIEDVLINLVGDRQDIIFLAQLGDELEVAARKHAAGRVVRRVDDDGAGLVIERCRQFGPVKRELGRVQADESRRRAAQDGVRSIVFIKRFEHDDFFARVDGRHQRGDHPFGRAAAYGQVGLRVELHTVIAQRFRDNPVAQALGAPGDRILVMVVHNRPAGGVLDLGRRREVGEALGQVHRFMLGSDAGHLPDHRFLELGCFVGNKFSH